MKDQNSWISNKLPRDSRKGKRGEGPTQRHIVTRTGHVSEERTWHIMGNMSKVYTYAAHLPHPSLRRVCLWGVHGHRTGCCLVGSTL